MWFERFAAPIADCEMVWLDGNAFVVDAVAMVVLAGADAVMFVGVGEMEDADILFGWESIWLAFIFVDIDFIEFNAVVPLSMAAMVVTVLSIGKFGWSAPVDGDDDGGDDDALAFDWSYSYFKTDVGLIGIDKFVLCLFSMIDVVSLAILDPSAVTFVMPKCTDCCLKIDITKIQSKLKLMRCDLAIFSFFYLANAMR